MRRGLGVFLWELAVALYLIAVGVLAFSSSGQLVALLRGINLNNNVIYIIAGIIALVGGIAILLDMFNIEIISFINILVLIIAIIWAVFIVIQIINWIGDGFGGFWSVLSQIAVNIMVCASLLVASKKFE